ncbi:MAG: DUF481 domain-containing protein [Deltaproteobacteria bacterium]|nr:DUF481 domain-containing protein [Deltaproteobacteria bacterium]
MTAVAAVACALALAQAPAADPASRAAAAAEKAAAAAQTAAEAAARAAAAAEKALERPAAAAPAAPAAAPAPAPAAWAGTAGLGLISLTGNSSSVVFNGAATVERKGPLWIHAGKASAAYGQTRTPSTGVHETTALAAGAFLRSDRRFTPSTSAYLLAGVETDHVKSVEVRYSGELGTAIAWIDSAEGERKTFLRTDLGLRIAEEKRFRYYPVGQGLHLPEAVIVAPRAAVAFKHALSKDVSFTDDLEVLPSVWGGSRVLVNNAARVAARLTATFQLGVTFALTHDSAPAAGRKQTDTALGVSVEYGF